MSKLHIAGVLLVLVVATASAKNVLRIGVSDSDGPPIAVVAGNVLVSGLSRDLGSALADTLDRRPVFVVVSRKRVEWALESGTVDIVCNANPAWYEDAGQLGWTQSLYPQVERIATREDASAVRQVSDLAGRRIGTIRGYTYPQIEPLWANGKAGRSNEDRLALMMKSLQSKVTDAAIVSELEFGVWARANPAAAQRIRIQPYVVSSIPTSCAVSPRAKTSVTEMNRAIEQLRAQGRLKAILHTYEWPRS
jgi:polar amino acid transport system substrate-binding protein